MGYSMKGGGISIRNSRLRLSVTLNLILRALNLILNFVLVPILITYLGKDNYGIWVTIYAFISWLNIFDVGLGQGLRLKLTEAFSLNKVQEIRALISSTYWFVIATSCFLFVIFLIFYLVFNWSSFLGIDPSYYEPTNYAIGILVLFFLLIFISKLIGAIFASLQFPYIDYLIKTLGQLFFLGLVLLLSNFRYESSLILVSLFSVVPLFLFYLGFSIYFFNFKSPSLIPRIRNISRKTLNDIVKPSISFFVIQIGYIILYSTDNIIIINLLSEEAVADFNVYYKYYSIPFLFFGIFLSSHSSSFIDALSKKDVSWVKDKIKFFNIIFLFLIGGYLILFFANEWLISLWIGKEKIDADGTLGVFLILYFLISSLISSYITVINANGKLKIQMICYIIISIINIPMSIFFVKYYNMGSEGVIAASIVSLIVLLIYMPIQYSKIVEGKISGVWNE